MGAFAVAVALVHDMDGGQGPSAARRAHLFGGVLARCGRGY